MNNTVFRLSLVAITLAAVSMALGFSPPPPPPLVQSAVSASPVTVAASTDGVAVTLDTSRPYGVYHTGKSAAGAAATGLVAIGYGAASTAADYSADTNKLILEAGGTVLIERGPATIYLKSASGAPIIQFVPKVRIR